MQTRTYTERSNARRAARAAGLDPESIVETEDGFEVRFPPPTDDEPVAIITDKQRFTVHDESAIVLRAGPEQSVVRGGDGKAKIVSNTAIQPAHQDDGLDIPEALKLSPQQRREAWEKNPPKAAPAKPKEPLSMSKPKAAKKKADRPPGTDKTTTLLKMLEKGATVDALCRATDWLPHTLRARISRLHKPKSKGGEGLKIERDRVDGVTSYRITS